MNICKLIPLVILVALTAPGAQAQQMPSNQELHHRFQQMDQMMEDARKSHGVKCRQLMEGHMQMMHDEMQEMHGMMGDRMMGGGQMGRGPHGPGGQMGQMGQGRDQTMHHMQSRMDMMQKMMEQMQKQHELMLNGVDNRKNG